MHAVVVHHRTFRTETQGETAAGHGGVSFQAHALSGLRKRAGPFHFQRGRASRVLQNESFLRGVGPPNIAFELEAVGDRGAVSSEATKLRHIRHDRRLSDGRCAKIHPRPQPRQNANGPGGDPLDGERVVHDAVYPLGSSNCINKEGVGRKPYICEAGRFARLPHYDLTPSNPNRNNNRSIL
jgi:hypothetical protein